MKKGKQQHNGAVNTLTSVKQCQIFGVCVHVCVHVCVRVSNTMPSVRQPTH